MTEYLVHLADDSALDKFRELVKEHAHRFHSVSLEDGSHVAIIQPTDNGYKYLEACPGAVIMPHRADPDPIEDHHYASISKSVPGVKKEHTSYQVQKLIFKATGEHHLFR